MRHGGKPKGYKHKKTLEKEAAREALRALVTAQLKPLVDAQIEAARGIKYLVKRSKSGGKFELVTQEQAKAGLFSDPDIIVEVWDKAPSTAAFTDLMNRALDKPMEQAQTVNLNVSGSIEARLKAARDRLKRHGDSESGA